jgi:hypothetical protein
MSVRGLTAAGAVLPRPPARTSCAAYSCPVRAPHTRAAQHATTRPAGATCFSQVFVLWRPAVVCAKVLHWSSLVFFGCDSKPRQSKPQLGYLKRSGKFCRENFRGTNSLRVLIYSTQILFVIFRYHLDFPYASCVVLDVPDGRSGQVRSNLRPVGNLCLEVL